MDSEFTEEEKKYINDLVNVDPNEDGKELAVCKAKLVVAEQTVVVLEAQLKQVTHQLEDENSRTMLAYAQMNELNNKLKSAEFHRLEEAMESEKEIPPILRQRLGQNRKTMMAKPSLFPEKLIDNGDDEVISCFRLDDDNTCKIL